MNKLSTINNPADTAVSFKNVTVERGGISILDNVTAAVPRGGCTAIIGPNGAGKTTMLLALLGEVAYKGFIHTACNINGSCSKIGYVPQRFAFDRGIPVTVAEFLAMGIQKKPLWFGIRNDLKNQSLEYLASVKSEHLAKRKLGALSGGEMQRVLLALALQQEPELLVLDEPASGVDFQGEYIFCELLDGLRKAKGFTQLMVSHDLATVTHHANHVICLNHKVAAQGPPQQALTNETLTAIFGMHMGMVDSSSMPDGSTICSGPCCNKDQNA